MEQHGQTTAALLQPCNTSCRWLLARRRAFPPELCPSRASCHEKTLPCAALAAPRCDTKSRHVLELVPAAKSCTRPWPHPPPRPRLPSSTTRTYPQIGRAHV